MVWKPHVTVAAVIEQHGKFLLVEEHTSEGVLFNQPAGHLEPGESLLDAVIRETLEESAYHFLPTALVGIYQWHQPLHDRTYLRFAYTGEITGHDAERTLDTGIIRALWLTPEEISAQIQLHRSPLVMDSLQDYMRGARFPLNVVTTY
ncbi:NUDIX hydrolase [Sulfuriferula nivalis]|uniref:Phosphatase NudJ n=1 Tax=Sulfuriferula nivalis TaxID=2675298 RepID=A0A809RGI3_9PROT|nr:NUDIX hydrolase [Sulfuriferula nivalis]BBO99983.1 NUDIX hydrolase [Sulfuriferula nivalis]